MAGTQDVKTTPNNVDKYIFCCVEVADQKSNGIAWEQNG